MTITPAPTPEQITGLVLAGGAGRRMGGADKGLIEIAGKPLVQWVADALRPQTSALLISANRNLEQYSALGWPVATDPLDGFQGPLAGIAAALERAQTPWLLVSPCDTPLIPPNLRLHLADALQAQDASIAIAADRTRTHPLHALLPCHAQDDLKAYLGSGGRSMVGWLERHPVATAILDEQPSPFSNLNRPGQDAEICRRLRERQEMQSLRHHQTQPPVR